MHEAEISHDLLYGLWALNNGMDAGQATIDTLYWTLCADRKQQLPREPFKLQNRKEARIETERMS